MQLTRLIAVDEAAAVDEAVLDLRRTKLLLQVSLIQLEMCWDVVRITIPS